MAIDVTKTTFPTKVQWTHPAVPPISIDISRTYEAIKKDKSIFIVNDIEFDVMVFGQVFDEVIIKTITEDSTNTN